MPHRLVAVVLVVMVLASCGSTPAPTATSRPPTETPVPVPTATTGPTPDLANVTFTRDGVEQILFVSGDLPTDWSTDVIYDEPPVDYSGPRPAYVINYHLKRSGDERQAGGMVYFWAFRDAKSAEAAYEHRADLLKFVAQDTPAFRGVPAGEEGLSASGEAFAIPALVFRRCNTVVEIHVGVRDEQKLGIDYANLLDQRLQQVACP